MKRFLILFFSFFSCLIFSEGFIAGTLVKTPYGYAVIESLSVGDFVICLDENNCSVERPITHVFSVEVDCYALLYIDTECIGVSIDQKLCIGLQQNWAAVSYLRKNDFLLTYASVKSPIQAVKYVDGSVCVYCLSVQEHHNFFVSHADLCAHNFFPVVLLGFMVAFGGGVEFAGISCGFAALGGYLGYKWHNKSKQHNIDASAISFGGGMVPDDPDDEDEKKRIRDEKRANDKPLTNKEARELAKELGYREIKSHPCGNTQGKPVFTNGREYISPDRTVHKGGVWKLFDKIGKRFTTANSDLTKIIGT